MLPLFVPLVTHVPLFVLKHVTCPYLLHRHRILGPWTRAGVLIQLAYLAVNLFYILIVEVPWDSLRAATFSDAGRQASALAELNMIHLFAGPYLAFLADRFGFSLKTIRSIHRSAGWMTSALVLLYTMAALSDGPLPLGVPQNLFAVIAASLLCLLLVFLFLLFRYLSYELFIRSHQALALIFIYTVWRHLPSDNFSLCVYIYIYTVIFASISFLQSGAVIVQNGVFRHHLSRAMISHDSRAVKMHIHLSKPLYLDAGQYINLWIPSISFWPFLQSHPFTDVSWAVTEYDILDLLIEPRRGLMRELLCHTKKGHIVNPIIMFSGPHGPNVSIVDYDSILMVASGFGIAAVLPHLGKLVYGYDTRVVRACRIHLVWQIENKGSVCITPVILHMQYRVKKVG
ncbi:hypothetical protein OIDMADRAFT_61376 [Oidiodendron maius Zn]|uniref:FAD-binding FR-type domain-containing protein n=1 Tax=Oidiodendron maius (strain Zn) TaxID=913774 RepID=A0A0C3CVL0_OIDMZ|nr:hypothetical protein OIDMADRAFT_61376 [Oidiodendron maius Zn]